MKSPRRRQAVKTMHLLLVLNIPQRPLPNNIPVKLRHAEDTLSSILLLLQGLQCLLGPEDAVPARRLYSHGHAPERSLQLVLLLDLAHLDADKDHGGRFHGDLTLLKLPGVLRLIVNKGDLLLGVKSLAAGAIFLGLGAR